MMAVIASYTADRLRRSGKLSTTATRKVFTTFALLAPGAMMVIQAIWGVNPALSVTVFTASLFFNGAVTAGYLANALDIAPNFSGTIFGLANTLSSFGGWLSTKLVAILTRDESSFDTWRYVFWMLVGTYIGGAVMYLVFGTGNLQKWNAVQETDVADAEGKVQEMKPLKTDEEKDEGKTITD